jgi:hypothetical protein
LLPPQPARVRARANTTLKSVTKGTRFIGPPKGLIFNFEIVARVARCK